MITYLEESDYGQAILEIMAEIAELTDPDREYIKNEIVTTLRKVGDLLLDLRLDVISKPIFDRFFKGDIE